MKISQLREIVKKVVSEETEYQQLFMHMLDKTGKDIGSMSDDETTKFFNAVDRAYKAKSEGRLRGYNEASNTIKEALPPFNFDHNASRMRVGKGRYDDQVLVIKNVDQNRIINYYMNNVAKNDSDRTRVSNMIWHSESQREFDKNIEKLKK